MTEAEAANVPWPNIAGVEGHLVGLGRPVTVTRPCVFLPKAATWGTLTSLVAYPLVPCHLASENDAAWLTELRESRPGLLPVLFNGRVAFVTTTAVPRY